VELTLNKADYGVDAPGVLRKLLIQAVPCLLLGLFLPAHALPWGTGLGLQILSIAAGSWFTLKAALYILYVRVGKYRRRDLILSLHRWRGDEQVLDIGCGRGLLTAAAAKVLAQLHGSGRVTGIDIWSVEDMAGNSADATRHNLEIEGVAERCALHSVAAQDMTFPDASFDVVMSNLCLHNIRDSQTRRRAVQQVARVLKPGGAALLSDLMHTDEYATELRLAGFAVEHRWGSLPPTIPPLGMVVARKPLKTA
jgi:ubiquinone/menaquinone biosynthesis C-methylase UbiE